MQLKRDTDYALRILFYIGGQQSGTDAASNGFSSSDISTQTGVPRMSVDRICGYLGEKRIIAAKTAENGEYLYYPGPGFGRKSLLEVVRAAEGGADIFAVFDRKSPFYRAHGARLREIQAGLDKLLSDISLKDFLGGER